MCKVRSLASQDWWAPFLRPQWEYWECKVMCLAELLQGWPLWSHPRARCVRDTTNCRSETKGRVLAGLEMSHKIYLCLCRVFSPVSIRDYHIAGKRIAGNTVLCCVLASNNSDLQFLMRDCISQLKWKKGLRKKNGSWKDLVNFKWIEDFCMDITMATHSKTSVPFNVCRLKLKPNSEALYCWDWWACLLHVRLNSWTPLLCFPKVTV